MIHAYGVITASRTKNYQCPWAKGCATVSDLQPTKSPSGRSRIVCIYELCTSASINSNKEFIESDPESVRVRNTSSKHSNTYENSVRYAYVQQLRIYRVLQYPRLRIGGRPWYSTRRKADSLTCQIKIIRPLGKSNRGNLPTQAILQPSSSIKGSSLCI